MAWFRLFIAGENFPGALVNRPGERMGFYTTRVVEAESAHQDLDHCSADGIRYVKEKLCWPQAAGSFEAGMGA